MQEQILNDCSSVVIGSDEWMNSNLQVTCYRNGDPIRQVNDVNEWRNTAEGAMCRYEGEGSNEPKYGCLYNWHAVNDPRGLAPEGWRIPEDKDWARLVEVLGGDLTAGGAMKDRGTGLWKKPNNGASNSSGFSALPCGFRTLYGEYRHLGLYSYFWSSTSYSSHCAWIRILGYFDPKVIHTGSSFENGYSVRCIKDVE
ncbi:MAG: fibrobacter succinogenes major paralogous domain-containing protein [Chlorobium sp.]|nr:fibrobacter succinogenes major paralogous domain-containing protein [Chlorobium sp.]MCW8815375.1 fibrobacter succinogenes major paralogous domain-containing protein [Chlorobium sp.]MCW8818920.1 fibrobacter succinogenes major paralogous domain-containing protein [Ignavibacteriaceae bacterium]